MSCCGPLSFVVLTAEIEGGVAESVGVFDVGPKRRRRRGSRGGSKGGAWFYGQVRLCGFREQRGTGVNTSCDRVLPFPIRQHTLLLYGSEKKGDCGWIVGWAADASRLFRESSHKFHEESCHREQRYNPPIIGP